MEFKVYRCAHCGNVAFKIVDKGVPLVCCGAPMTELVPNTTDGAHEKHVPSITFENGVATIAVGEVIHPMQAEHYIQFIAATCCGNLIIRQLAPGEEPKMLLPECDDIEAYELCNLHGFWKK